MLAESVLNSAGRSITVAPARSAVAAMAESSVETITRLTDLASRPASMARTRSERPPTEVRFFPGMPRDPPRAGITTTTRRSWW